MADENIYTRDDNIRQIGSIEFGIFDNNEIKRISALGKDRGIEIADLYESLEPKKGGLIDARLGTTSKHQDCATCGLNDKFCVGHFGHIELAEPVFHIGFLQQYVKNILGCICIRCSKLLIYKNEDEVRELLTRPPKMRFAEIRNAVKNVTSCSKKHYGCGTPVSKISLEIKKLTATVILSSETEISGDKDGAKEGDKTGTGDKGKKKLKQTLTPDMVYDILKNMSDTDCKIIGMDPTKCRPEMMINKIFPVPPVQIRPSARADYMSSAIVEDDLTLKLADIVKKNIQLKKYKETMNENTAKYSSELIHLLQYHVITYLNNETISLPKSEQKSRPTKSISTRLKGKEGRIRWNLMGKRVDFCARTVITSDPNISINQLGVPIKIAMNLTFPEIVTSENIKSLTKAVKNGKYVYPGANYVIHNTPDNKKVQYLQFQKDAIELKYGDIVERHLIDDDIVLLNRQPTLHKQSMMGHRIKVINDHKLNTFRLNVTIVKPYNADFDTKVNP